MPPRASTIRAREIGYQLRRYREACGMTQYHAAKKLGISTPSMSRIEDGTKPATSEDVAALLAIYDGTGPKRDVLIALAREVHESGWWQRYNDKLAEALHTLSDMETRACTITSYQAEVIPGLLQIPEYVEGLLRLRSTRPENEIRAKMKSRLARRHVLFRDDPVHLAAFISETALRRAYGSAAVLHRQLDYLLKMMERPNIIIRIVAGDAVDVPPVSSFQVLRFPASQPVAHIFNLAGDLFLENQDEIFRFDQAVHGLMQSALDTGESAGLITRLMRKLEADPDVLPILDRPSLEEE